MDGQLNGLTSLHHYMTDPHAFLMQVEKTHLIMQAQCSTSTSSRKHWNTSANSTQGAYLFVINKCPSKCVNRTHWEKKQEEQTLSRRTIKTGKKYTRQMYKEASLCGRSDWTIYCKQPHKVWTLSDQNLMRKHNFHLDLSNAPATLMLVQGHWNW